MKTYRNLPSDKIIETLAILGERINQRFPNCGLYQVCEELVQMAEADLGTGERDRTAGGLAAPAADRRGAGQRLYGLRARGRSIHLHASNELAGVLQGLEADGQPGPHRRWRRTVPDDARGPPEAASRSDGRCTSSARSPTIIAIHQLTKDPSAFGGPRTGSSPDRSMTRDQLVPIRAIAPKCCRSPARPPRLRAETQDSAIIDAVGDIEKLGTNLSQNILQKITLVETDIEEASGAIAVSAGEKSQLPRPGAAYAAMVVASPLDGNPADDHG